MREEAHRDLPDPLRDDLFLFGLRHAKRDVRVASQQVLVVVGHDELKLDVWERRRDAREDRRQAVDGHDLRGGDSYASRQRLSHARRVQSELRGGRMHGRCVGHQRLRGVRGAQAAGAFEEHRAELLFEFGDVASDRWLADPHRASRAGQRPGLHHRVKAAHEIPVHPFSIA